MSISEGIKFMEMDGEHVDINDFIKFLKCNNEYDQLIRAFSKHRVAIIEAEKFGLQVDVESLQQTVDDFRRYLGIFRAKDTFDWLESQGLTIEDLEQYITEQILKKNLVTLIASPEKIQEFFTLNIPMFDSVDIQHIVVDDRGKADEIMSILGEEPDMFRELSEELSIAEGSGDNGGMTGLRRGVLPAEIEAKVFNADEGEVVGPFQIDDENLFEIILVKARKSAELNDTIRQEIEEKLHEEWITARMREHSIVRY